MGSGAYAYHNHECQGLNQCEADTMHVTIEGAKSKGRGKPCGYCYWKRKTKCYLENFLNIDI